MRRLGRRGSGASGSMDGRPNIGNCLADPGHGARRTCSNGPSPDFDAGSGGCRRGRDVRGTDRKRWGVRARKEMSGRCTRLGPRREIPVQTARAESFTRSFVAPHELGPIPPVVFTGFRPPGGRETAMTPAARLAPPLRSADTNWGGYVDGRHGLCKNGLWDVMRRFNGGARRAICGWDSRVTLLDRRCTTQLGLDGHEEGLRTRARAAALPGCWLTASGAVVLDACGGSCGGPEGRWDSIEGLENGRTAPFPLQGGVHPPMDGFQCG